MKKTSIRSAVLCALLSFSSAATAWAQLDLQPNHTGAWKYTWRNSLTEPKLTPAEMQTVKSQMAGIAAVIANTPLLQPPKGVEVAAFGRNDMGCTHDEHLCKWRPVPGWVEISLYGLYKNSKGAVVSFKQDPPGMTVAVNDPREATRGNEVFYQGLFDEKDNEIVFEPREIARIGDVVVYNTNTIILARPGKPLFVPVTAEHYLRSLMAHEKEPMVKDMIRKEIAALSPARLRSQAYHGLSEGSITNLVAPRTPDSTPLVMFNPDYFDATLPRTAIQLITLRSLWSNDNARPPVGEEYDHAQYRTYELQEAISYDALARLLR